MITRKNIARFVIEAYVYILITIIGLAIWPAIVAVLVTMWLLDLAYGDLSEVATLVLAAFPGLAGLIIWWLFLESLFAGGGR